MPNDVSKNLNRILRAIPTPSGVGIFLSLQWGSLLDEYAPPALPDGPKGLRWFYFTLLPRKGEQSKIPFGRGVPWSAVPSLSPLVTERGYPRLRPCADLMAGQSPLSLASLASSPKGEPWTGNFHTVLTELWRKNPWEIPQTYDNPVEEKDSRRPDSVGVISTELSLNCGEKSRIFSEFFPHTYYRAVERKPVPDIPGADLMAGESPLSLAAARQLPQGGALERAPLQHSAIGAPAASSGTRQPGAGPSWPGAVTDLQPPLCRCGFHSPPPANLKSPPYDSGSPGAILPAPGRPVGPYSPRLPDASKPPKSKNNPHAVRRGDLHNRTIPSTYTNDYKNLCTNWVRALPGRLLCLLSWRSKKVWWRSRKVIPPSYPS